MTSLLKRRTTHSLWSSGGLFEYRDKIAHSQPDRGDRYNRIRRRHGLEERFAVTEEELTAELDRGMRCQSTLTSVSIWLDPDLRLQGER